MTNRLRCFLAATVLCLSLPAAGLAQPPGSQLPDTVAATASGAAAELPAVAAPAQAAPQVVYLVAPQPTAAVAPATSSSGGSVALGILGAIPGEVWGALLGIIATLVFSFWKGSAADKARSIVLQLAEGAWYVAERSGGTGAAKLEAACDSFYKSLTGAGLSIDAKTIALRDSTFTAMSAADKLARQRALEAEIRLDAKAKAEAEAKPATAGELLAEAARS